MKKILFSLLAALALTSCGDFLDEYTTDERYCETAQDLEDLMKGECFIQANNMSFYAPGTMNVSSMSQYNLPYLHILDDDADMNMLGFYEQGEYKSSPKHLYAAMYRWAVDPRIDDLNKKWGDQDWTRFYKHIAALNSIIYQCGEVKAEKEADKSLLQHINGEARFLRAYYYFYLANLYGMPYAKATAQTDFCVPLKTSEVIEDHYFSRASNAEVWNQIDADLDVAAELLKGYTPNTKIRVGYYAVKAFQSRVALYMENYQKAIDCADAFNGADYQLTDLNSNSDINVVKRSSKDLIFTMSHNELPGMFYDDYSTWDNDITGNYGPVTIASCFRASQELTDSYSPADLRRTKYFKTSSTAYSVLPNKIASWQSIDDSDGVGAIFALRYAEVVLNKAEAQALLNKEGDAANTLKDFVAKRYDLSQGTVPTESNIIDRVRAERRRELCFEGHRWFDLRRYAVNSVRPLDQDFTISHNYYGVSTVTGQVEKTGKYVLESFAKDKAGWILPVPDETIIFNRGEITNLERKDRQIIKN